MREEMKLADVEVLSFSGGWQSSALAWMYVRGELPQARHFAAVTADTGDERPQTYDYWRLMSWEFIKSGIQWLEADGPKIPDDWDSGRTANRIDTIPYFVDKGGTRGQLMHQCTRHYKVRPMRRAITKWLAKRLWISKVRAERVPVTCLIGFAADEQHRADDFKEERTWKGRFPLIELGMTKDDCVSYHRDNGLPDPIESVCAGCFGHGLRSLRWMKENTPTIWARLKRRDSWVRHALKPMGVKYDVYMSDTLKPLQELEDNDFKLESTKETVKHECNSGVCFT